MPTTTIHLLRHGEVHNPQGLLYGRLAGYHLSDRGRAMAQLVADFLAGKADAPRADIVDVAASPLERAQETAAPVAQAFGLQIHTDWDLIEGGNSFEGQIVTPASLLKPSNLIKLRNPLAPSWGEHHALIAQRMMRALRRARIRAEGHEGVLVSHQLPVWILRTHLEGRPYVHDPRRRQCSLASLTSVVFEGARVTQIVYREPARSLLPGSSGVGA